jgi:hypothetical protein
VEILVALGTQDSVGHLELQVFVEIQDFKVSREQLACLEALEGQETVDNLVPLVILVLLAILE